VVLPAPVSHRPPLGGGIAEADVLEHEPGPDRHRHLPTLGIAPDVGLDLEEREQVVQVEALLEHL
jgi:hypothetical protein